MAPAQLLSEEERAASFSRRENARLDSALGCTAPSRIKGIRASCAIIGSTMLHPVQPARLADSANGFLAWIDGSVMSEWCIAVRPWMRHNAEYSKSKNVGVLPWRIVRIIAS